MPARTLSASYVLDSATLRPGIADADAQLAGLGKTGDKLSEDFDKNTSKMGGLFEKLGNTLSNWGLPFGTSLTNMGKKMDETKGKGGSLMNTLSSVGKVATVAMVAGVVAFGAASLKMGMDNQKAVTQYAASADISVAKAKQVGNALLDTGGKTIFTGTAMLQALQPVAGQFSTLQSHALSAAQAVKVEMAAADLAEASNEGLGATTKDLASIMQSFQVPISKVSQTADELYSTSRLTGVGIDSLASTMQRLHSRLGVLTPSVGGLDTMLVDLGEHGVTGSRGLMVVNTAMTTMLKPMTAVETAQIDLKQATDALPPSLQKLASQYQTGTMSATQVTAATKGLDTTQAALWKTFASASDKVTSTRTAYSNLGLSVLDTHDKFVGMGSVIAQLDTKLRGESQAMQLATLSTDFGTSANKALLATVLGGASAWDKAQKAVEKSNAAHLAAEKQDQSLSRQMEVVKSQVVDLGTKFGNALIPKLEDVAHVGGDLISFFEHSKVAAIALGVIVGGPLAASMAIFAVKSLGGVVGKMKELGTNVTHLGSVFSQSAGGMAEQDAGADELTATISRLDQTLGNVAAKLPDLTGGFGELTDVEQSQVEVSSSIQASNDALAASYAAVEEAQTSLSAGFTELEGVEEGFAATSEETGAASSAAFGPVGIAIMALVTVGTLVATHWKTISHDIVRAWDDVFSFGKKIFGDLESFFKKWGKDLLLVFAPTIGIPLFLATHWRQVLKDATEIWGDVESFFKSIPSKLLSVFSGAGSWLVDIGKRIIDGLLLGFEYLTPAGLILKFHTQILSALSDAGSWLLDAGKSVVHGLLTGLEDVGELVAFVTVTIPQKILGAFASAGSWLLHAGEDVLSGLWHGIVAGWGALGDLGRTVEGWLVSALKGAGTWLLQVGEDIVKGLVKGIESAAKLPEDAIKKVGEGVIGVAKSIWHVLSPSAVFADIGTSLVQGLAKGIEDSKKLATDAMADVDVLTKLNADALVFTANMSKMNPTIQTASSSLTIFDTRLVSMQNALTTDVGVVTRLNTDVLSLSSSMLRVGTSVHDAVSSFSSFGTELNSVEGSLTAVIRDLDTSLTSEMHNVGVDMAQGLISGLAGSQGAIDAAVNSVGTGMVNTMKSSVGAQSPSTLFALVGRDIMAGVVVGVQTGTSAAVSSLESAALALRGVHFGSPAAALPAIAGAPATGVPGGIAVGAAGGSTQITVQVTVQGQVLTERNLVDAIWHGLVEKGVVNGSPGQVVGV